MIHIMDASLAKHKVDSRICSEGSHSLSKLCMKCRELFFHDWARVEGIQNFSSPDNFLYWENVSLFEKAAAEGCHLCILFLAQCPDSLLFEAHRSLERNYAAPLTIGFQRYQHGSWTLHLGFELQVAENRWIRAENVAVGMVPTSVSGPFDVPASGNMAASTLLQAKKWIGTCAESHPKCMLSKDAKSPTRLIAVTEKGPRLVLSAELPCRFKYATLSHCWGSLKILQLKKDNLTTLQKGIPWDGLCKTFQDAYKATQDFGISYLWIDSLCIIQDDPDDWDREAVLMSTVYGGSCLNIAASDAKDGSMGLSSARRYPLLARKLQICIPSFKESTLERNESQSPAALPPFDRLCPGTLYDLAPKDLQDCVTKSLLAQRAWVLQERVLSHRNLHFSSQLFWECNELLACEAFPDGLPGLFQKEHDSLQQTQNEKHWQTLVQFYTLCKLTFQKDKLIAMAGIAQRVQDRYGDEYVAGLWRKDIETHLGWQIGGGTRAFRPPSRAPSWSWAAVDSPVVYPLPNSFPHLLHVLDAHLIPLRESLFGDIRSGILTIGCGHLLLFTLLPPKSDAYSYPSTILSGGRILEPGLHINWDYLEAKNSTGELYLLSSAMHGNTSSGYVLEATGCRKGEYRRLGKFALGASYRDPIKKLEDIQFLRTALECHAPESAYTEMAEDDAEGNKQFVVTLV